MTRRHMLMTAGLLIAAWLALFGDKTPAPQVAEPVTRSKAASDAAARPRTGSDAANIPKQDVTIVELIPRDKLIGQTLDGKVADRMFAQQTWTPPPPPPPKVEPPPPSAPPLPFTYLGKKSEQGKWEAYLAKGDQTFIVQEHTVIDNTYRVDAIKPPTLSLTYLPLNQMQTLAIGGTD